MYVTRLLIERNKKMASLEQEQEQGEEVGEIVSTSFKGSRSNRIEKVDFESHINNPPCIDHDYQNYAVHIHQESGWKKFLSHVGPGFLVATAYLDPNNLETDLQAGANHGYQLLWVILIGLIFALIIQAFAANLGVITGKHLAQLCKDEYPRCVNICLWVLAEIAVIGADIPEVIGTAFALNILFHIPLWAGVIMTGFISLLLISIQKYGERKLEMLTALLVFIMAACFFGEMSYVKPPVSAIFKGLLVPNLSGNGATSDAIALIGSLIMPHNLFLHSALVLSRKAPNTVYGINDAYRYFVMELGLTLSVALVINVSIVAVSGTVCLVDNLSPENADRCNDLSAKSASFLLKNVLGKSSSIVYGVALLASGQSSAVTSTYSGQFIMQGFLNLKMKKWARNILTRGFAIVPSLIVTIISGSSGASRLIIVTAIIISVELPFALIPLLKFSSSTKKMGPHKRSIYVIVLSWVLGFLIIGINVHYLSSGYVRWLIRNNLPKVANLFIGILVFLLMAIYVVAVIYLIFRKDKVVTYVEPLKSEHVISQANAEIDAGKSNEKLYIDHEVL